MQKSRVNRSAITVFLVAALALAASVLASCARRPTTELSVSFNDGHGKDVSLKLRCSDNCVTNLKGKVVLVNFWATWCDPCRGEIPSLIQFQQKYADKGFTMLGIAMDEDGARRRTST
jgi:thiol-disulfide isomerase/thioredoxin